MVHSYVVYYKRFNMNVYTKNVSTVQTRKVFALMGDIIDSESAVDKRTLHANFNTVIDSANEKFRHSLISPLTITLGDEFQGFNTQIHNAYEIATYIRLYLLELQIRCRFVIAQVEIETPINKKIAWNMMGKGLAEARNLLEQKSDPNIYRFLLPDYPLITPLLNAVGLAMTDIEESWTKTQTGYMYEMFKTLPEIEEIANSRNVTQRNVYKVLSAAKYGLYKDLRHAHFATLLNIDDHLRSTDK